MIDIAGFQAGNLLVAGTAKRTVGAVGILGAVRRLSRSPIQGN
jgi:hypothetical protein